MSKVQRISVAGIATAFALALAFNPGAVRLGLALALCLVLPGWGWARRLRLYDLGDTLGLAVVLSIGATVAVGTTMAVSGRWSTTAGLVALGLIATVGFEQTSQFLVWLAEAVPRRVAVVGDHLPDDWAVWYAAQKRLADAAEARREAEARAAEAQWADWYAGARRRADEERMRAEASARAEWAAWYAETQAGARGAGRWVRRT